VTKLTEGLHARDGYQVHYCPDASLVILHRGSVSSDLIASAPNLRLIQRLGARSESIDVVAAEAGGVVVSCPPRRTLVYTAEHVLLLMLSFAKCLLVVTGLVDGTLTSSARAFAYGARDHIPEQLTPRRGYE
jgi:phosphoglycerate dehydrogenase-like enzyme